MRFRLWFVAMAALFALAGEQRGLAALAGGTAIVNSASATYADAGNQNYSTVSNQITSTLAKIAGVVVTPKQNAADATVDGVPSGQTATRTFVVTNASNIADSYEITSVDAGTHKILSVTFVMPDGTTIPAQIHQTVTPLVNPGAHASVRVVIDTSTLAVGAVQEVRLTAQTTTADVANGLQNDTGTEWIVGATAAKLVGPSGANAQVQKTVNRSTSVQSQPGATVTFDISAQNAGGTPATNVMVGDDIPDGLTVDLSTVTVNGMAASSSAKLTGRHLDVTVGTLAAGASIDVGFTATVSSAMTIGSTFVNIATISADGQPAQKTTPASVLVGTSNVVFDGYAGAGHPIGGAVVTLLDAQGNPVSFSSSSSSSRFGSAATASSSAFVNPIVTGSSGAYGFPVPATAIATNGSTFYLTIAAPGFLNRKIRLDILPDPNGTLYTVTTTSQDGQPLAIAGGYTLTNTSVKLTDVFGLFGNVPLFAARTIAVTKTGDRDTVAAGDRVVFTLTFSNSSTGALAAADVVDTLPPGLVYANGTATLDGARAEPIVNGRTLTWTVSSLAPGKEHDLRYATAVFPTAVAGSELVNSVRVGAVVPGTLVTVAGSASASVHVIGSAFTQRRIITGRVFADIKRTGRFVKGDTGIPNVRVFMENGDYAITDVDGRFSFAGARPGMHVLRVDTSSLPPSVRAFRNVPMNSTRSLERLVHGIMDDGVIEDVNFAVESI